MQTLKDQESDLLKLIAETKETLAKKEQSLKSKKKDLAATEEEKKELEKYLKTIKPGCDFIMENLDLRIKNRAAETKALKEASVVIKKSPAHKNAVAERHLDSFGECRETCEEDEAHVDCKACMADVSVPGYCAGHKGTKGC
jgi:hypothetical protein